MNKAVFLDRDGVLIEDTHYITSRAKVKIYDFAREAIENFRKLGYLTIVVSNQSAIARGMVSLQEVFQINTFIKEKIGFDDIYFCPHLPLNKSKERNIYTIDCECRKPNSLMGRNAIIKHNIDINNSYMVGDRKTDILFAENLGLKSVLVLTGKGIKEKPEIDFYNYCFDNVYLFSQFLERENNDLWKNT